MQIKFLTLNILKGNLLSDVIDFLRSENPDIFVLQEVYNGSDRSLERKYRSFSIIKHELDIKHAVFAPAFLDATENLNVENGNAIFSKYPITASDAVFFDIPFGPYIDVLDNFVTCPRNLLHGVTRVGSFSLDVFNIHGIWGFDGADNKRRLEMSRTIADALKGKEKIILAGDFNLQPSTQTIRNIEMHLRNVFKDELTTTFNMKRKTEPGYAAAVVDMIFTSRNIKTLKHYCPEVDISDHLPLVCVSEI